MRYNPEIHRRRSIRIKGYDYARSGSYFITLCTRDRECWFGEVVNGTVQLSPIGKAACDCWLQIPLHFPNAVLDEFVVMPNHIHGIVNMVDPRRGVKFNAPTKPGNFYSLISPKDGTLSVVIRTYKSAVTRWCRQNGFDHFQWQRNYYEHIIRNETDMNKIRQYILDNPRKWDEDDENPYKEKQNPHRTRRDVMYNASTKT